MAKMATQFVNWHAVGTGSIKVGTKIGSGGQSTIYKGSFGGKNVAVKEVTDKNHNELLVLRDLEHENIIKYIHMETTGSLTYIVLELCYCNLKQYVEETSKEIPLQPVQVLKQITGGLYYLHNGQTYCTVHRDLKPSNILFRYVKREKAWRVKISDFGLSKDLDSAKTSTASKSVGSTGYTAPELLCLPDGSKGTGRIRKETDIFSAGVIFYYTLSGGKHPFGNDPLTVDMKVRDSDPDLGDLQDEYKGAESLILSMIDKQWEKRTSASHVKAHHIFWRPKEKLDFFQKVSDYLEDKKKHQGLINKLEKECKEITGGNWKEKVCNDTERTAEIKRVLEKRQTRDPKLRLQDLLRQIRNWAHHYNDKDTTDKLREELGPLPDGFVLFFTSRFPCLLEHIYNVMRDKKDDPIFRNFYGENNPQEIQMSGAHSFHPTAEVYAKEEPLEDDLLALPEENNGSESTQLNTSILRLRKYQFELAEQALSGHNSLIVAPTGSGKTAVANEIIKNHLQQDNSKSVLFFVSKTTLACQQYEFFSRHLKGHVEASEVAYLIGKITSNAPVGAIMKKMKLTVLTPQIFIDEFSRKKSFIQFSDISMMIFDECHNATKNHPYKQIMNMLLDYEANTQIRFPIQIVGMTASPGVGKGKDRETVLQNLISLLANLNIIHCPAVVVRHVEELKKYQNDIAESYIRVPDESDVFSQKILKAMELIEDKIRQTGMFGSKPRQVPEPSHDKSKQLYENWVINLIDHVRLKVYDTEPSQQSLARITVTYAEHLKMYHTLLYLKKHIPNAMEVTNSLASFDQDGDEGRFLRRIQYELKRTASDYRVPMLEKLFEELKKQFEANLNSRCIVFVPRKYIAVSLVDCIKSNPGFAHLEPVYLTGTNDQATAGGMTKTEQDISLKAFKDGKSKIMISTSVSEEGLDIRACNLVIMYNYVTGEVGRIQRAGRGRAHNSKSILIVPYGSEKIEREKMNAVCAAATEYAIGDLNELPPNERVAQIRKVQRLQANERKKKRSEQQQRLQEASKWRILCGKCQAFITTADQLRQIKNQHKFVIDKNFYSRVKKKFYGELNEITPGVIGVGAFHCIDGRCKNYIGLEMQYKGKNYPTLSVKQLIFEDDLGARKTAKQWNKCPFAIEKGMEESDEEDVEVTEEAVRKFAADQAGEISHEMDVENLSDDEANELLYYANYYST